MNRSNVLGAMLLVVGLLLGGLIVERAGAQARSTRTQAWPPAPEDIVNVRAAVAGIQDGDLMNAYVVPSDKWLILTDLRFDVEADDGSLGANWSSLELGEDLNGTFTPKVGEFTGFNPAHRFKADRSYGPSGGGISEARIPYISVMGKVFRPGSHVAIRYTNANDPRDDGFAMTVSCNLTGYLVAR